MNLTNNTILITGGGSGIGRGLAEALHEAGNRVIIAGRRQETLDEVTSANEGMASIVLDIDDAASLPSFVAKVTGAFPYLNVLVNNAGIMRREDVLSGNDALRVAEETIATNLLGPIRLTAALLPHLRRRSTATILMVTSGLAFVPRTAFPTYSASKAAMHSYSQSLRDQLKDTSVSVIEIAPPRVQTTLTGPEQANDPMGMPLDAYVAEVMALLKAQPDTAEIIVERCKPLRHAEADGTYAEMFARVNPA